MYNSRLLHKLLTWIVVCAQVVALAGTATVSVLQPTPQMAQEAAQQAGLGNWFSQVAARITQSLQPLWGEAATAEASAIRDVGPHPGRQWLTTIHPEENWVVNGSFEMGPEGLNITSIPGWTIASGRVDLWGGYFRPDGSSSEIDLAGTPGPGVLEQTITGLTAGQSYFFEFSYSANTFANEQAKVQVLDGATPLLDQTVTAAGTPYSKGWQHFRQSFTAPASGSVKLRFQDLSVDPYTSYGVIIDDVRVARRLINYVINGSFEAGPHGLNTTIIPNWTVDSGRVDIHGGYFHPDGSTAEMDLAGTPGPGTASQVVSGLTAGQSYLFEFDYTVNAIANEQARVQVLDGGTPLINQVVTVNGDANHKGWKHFRQSFTAPASGSVTLRFQDLSVDPYTSHGIMIDMVRVADIPLNYVVNGDFENSPAALNIANDAIPGWTTVSGPVDVFNPGLLYDKMVDLNGSPGNGKIEQMVTGLTVGQVYAFQFNYQNHASWTTYAYARLLDSANVKLYEKRVSCKGHVVHEGWCTLRYFFTAPANGQVKIVFENDETDGNPYYGTNIDNVFISRNLDFVVNGNFASGPTGLNQTKVPGWEVGGRTDTHDGYGGEYRFLIDLNGTPGDGQLRQVINGLAPGQSYNLRYNYASHIHNYTVDFDIDVTNSDGSVALATVSHSTNKVPNVGGWQQAQLSFTAPADGIVQLHIANNETDNNLYYGPFIDNFQLWGTAATAGTEVNVCNGTSVLPKPAVSIGPGGVTSGLEHWVRADKDVFSDAGTTPAVEGSSVQQWNDQAGGNLHLTQTTAGQQPTYRAGVARGNFNPTLDYTDDFIRNTNRVVQTTDDLTFIAVGDTDVTSGLRTLYGMGNDYSDPSMDLNGTQIRAYFDGGSSVNVFNGALSTNEAMIWGMRGSNSETNGMRFNYSGEEVPINVTVANQANYGLNIGVGSDSGGEDWDGRIPEAMTFSRNLSSSEMEQIYSYLAVKYGITMRLSTVAGSTASGDYRNSAGDLIWNYEGNSNYHYDVAGIGRDDASDLEQKQSNSVNSDNLVTIGLGNIAVDNASNLSNFSADKSFLLWGNNNAPTAITATVSVSLTRMARIWTVQETTPITQPIGFVTVRVPQSAFSLGAGQAAFFMRSVDPIFTTADDVIFMICDGTNCSVEIDFADGDYFSVARASVAPEIVVNPVSNNFGNVGVTESSPVKNVAITNSGNAPLNLTNILMTNTGSDQFVNSNSCGATLNPGASCNVGVTFTPNISGTQNGTLAIGSNDSDEVTTTVSLSGVGVAQAPDINALPLSLSFTDTLTNSAALAQWVVITNSGLGNLAIQSLLLEGTDSDQFVIVDAASTCVPLTKNLVDNESCTIGVLFSPTSAGSKSASLIITTNDNDEITTTVTLSGAGVTCSGWLNTVTVTADNLEMVDQDNRAAACVIAATLPPDLTTTIGQPAPTFVAGSPSNVPITVTNAVTAGATTGPITTTLTLPTGTSAPASFSSGGNSCTTAGLSVTCVNTGTLAAGGSNVITVPVTPDNTTVGTQPVFNGTTATSGETDTSNNPASPMTPIVAVASGVTPPDLTTVIGQPSPTLVAGVASNLPVTVTNAITAGATTGSITTTLTLPTGVSAPASFTSNGNTCTTAGQTVTCVNPGPIAAGGSTTIQVPVIASNATAGTQPVFNGTTTTPGETNTSNNGATPLTPGIAVAAFVDGCFNGTVVLNGAQEVPSNNSTATGSASVIVNTTANTFDYNLTFSSLIPTMAHIHGYASAGGSAGVVHNLPGLSSPQISQWSFSEADQANILAGLSYFNLHSAAFGGGEIRGQTIGLAPTACPATSDLRTTIGQPVPALVVGVASNLPVTVTNDGTGATTAPITTTITLPSGVSAPASFSSNGNSCTTSGSTVTCVNPGPIAAGGSNTIQLPVTPDNSVVGTQPVFNATTTTPGDSNPGNNASAPLTSANPVANNAVVVTAPLKAILQGAYDNTSGLMRDPLRTLPSFPLTSPYGGGETTSAGVLAVAGNDAIVDWVLVELRDSTMPTTVIASKAGLIQRDGDVVTVDGTSTITFTVTTSTAYVAIRHRNHLRVMTSSAVALSLSTATVDFSNPATLTYGSHAQRVNSGKTMMWGGNANGDGSLILAGPSNDKSVILSTVLAAPGNTGRNTNYAVSGYVASDLNLDGQTVAAGPGNDINVIGINVFLHPGNISYAANYVVTQQ